MELIKLFTQNLPPRQRQYEAVRAVAFGEGTIAETARRFGSSPQSLRNLINRVKNGAQELFPEVKKGPRKRRVSEEAARRIVALRRERRLSSYEITAAVREEGISLGARTVERVLSEAGFPKLRRRTLQERGLGKKRTLLSARAENLELKGLKPFRAECQVAGVFLFWPYLLESGLLEVIKECPLPGSRDLGPEQAALSLLVLKLIGAERLSHVRQYERDAGFGVFAGLNLLPKPTYMCTYSCRAGAAALLDFQQRVIKKLNALYPELYQGPTINLDFHSIPHFGGQSEMEKVWCGSRGKALKGANTFFAQDGQSDALLYCQADIKRAESAEEIKNFVDYWLEVKGVIDQTLVFDSKLTRYDVLSDLDRAGVNFITLRRRSEKLIAQALALPDKEWARVYLPIPKRKYKHVKVHESKVSLRKGEREWRQLIVKDHGRAEPTFIITNRNHLKTEEVLTVYAKRWHIENKLSELVHFFNLNALSSPIMIRIHFDLLFSIIADTLYHLLARDLPRFEHSRAPSLFKRFIDMPGTVHYDGEQFNIKIRKHAATPILMGVKKLNQPLLIPWLENKPARIIWTP